MFKGSIPALITPFDNNNNIDLKSFHTIIEWSIKNGSHGFVPCGTTGESPTHTLHVLQYYISLSSETSSVLPRWAKSNW